jgi:hypothetical protein
MKITPRISINDAAGPRIGGTNRTGQGNADAHLKRQVMGGDASR